MSDSFIVLGLISFPIIIWISWTLIKKISFSHKFRLANEIAFTREQEQVLDQFIPLRFLSADEKKRFLSKLKFFLFDKNFFGVGDFEVTEHMKFIISCEACLMITNLNTGIYRGLKSIYVTQEAFIPKENAVNPQTGLPMHSARLGEAWKNGPIVLSWDSIQHGGSVVYHEFSHQLDQQDGGFDGTPDLGPKGNYSLWASVMGREFQVLREKVLHHKSSSIDAYGATNEAEFFAVVTEKFFVQPHHLQQTHPQLYDLYRSYFQLDPSSWKSS